MKKDSITFKELEDWIEKNRMGFYLGCRADPHSYQINEFVRGLHYYLEKDFGYVSEWRRQEKLTEGVEE